MKISSAWRFFSALLGCVALAMSPAYAKPGKGKGGQGNGHGGGHGKHEVDQGKKKDMAKPEKPEKREKPDSSEKHGDHNKFDDPERAIIISIFKPDNAGNLPPGLAKNAQRGKPLPPGWQKKIVPGYRIEDEWWPSFTPIPYDTFPQVRRVPGTTLYRYDNRLVRLLDATREIIDVLELP